MKKKVKIAFLDIDDVINSSKINKGYVGLIKGADKFCKCYE